SGRRPRDGESRWAAEPIQRLVNAYAAMARSTSRPNGIACSLENGASRASMALAWLFGLYSVHALRRAPLSFRVFLPGRRLAPGGAPAARAGARISRAGADRPRRPVRLHGVRAT